MKLLIGSTAAQPYLSRTPKDLDFFVSDPDEVDTPEDFYHPVLAAWMFTNCHKFHHVYGHPVADLDTLYTIKVSHSAWDLRNGSWFKHMSDLATLRNAGAVLDVELHTTLYEIWEERYGKKKVDLNKDYTAFFSDHVQRTWDHDSIHESLVHPLRPKYEKYLTGDVSMDMGKVWASTAYDILHLFLEEVLATALERWIIPSDYTCSPRWAYMQALKLTITSLTKGRSSRYMAENYGWFLDVKKISTAHFKNHKENLNLLRPYGGPKS